MKPNLACIVLITLFIAIGVSCYSARQSPRDLGDDFNAYVEKTLHEWGASGAMIVVVEGDQTVYMKGHGSRVPGENRPINETTVIQVASHTKTVTATAIAMLVEDGRLSWDDPVQKHIPEFELPDSYASEHATICDLLSHQIGLPSTPGGFTDPAFDFPALIEALRTRPLVFSFRERLGYSNAGYAVAGEIVSRASGMSWEQFIKQRIFRPLGMNSCYTSTPDMMADMGPPTVEKNIFMPVERDGASFVPGNWKNASCGVLYAPAGGILTTATDIAKWMVFQLNNGSYKGKRLVSKKAIWKMRKPRVLYDRALMGYHNPHSRLAAYGLGWVSFEYQGKMVYEHPGGWMGSNIAFIPEENLAVGIFTNANLRGLNSVALASALKMEVLERLLDAPNEDWSQIFLDGIQ